MRAQGVALFPADTVYGLACTPDAPEAVDRLYRLKGRRPDKPAAVMFFDRELALKALPELGERTRAALERVLPGGLTVLVPNPAGRFPLACGPDPATLGLRVPALAGDLAALAAVRRPVLQSSANVAGGPDARRIEDVPGISAAASTSCWTPASCRGRRRRWSTSAPTRRAASGRSSARAPSRRRISLASSTRHEKPFYTKGFSCLDGRSPFLAALGEPFPVAHPLAFVGDARLECQAGSRGAVVLLQVRVQRLVLRELGAVRLELGARRAFPGRRRRRA